MEKFEDIAKPILKGSKRLRDEDFDEWLTEKVRRDLASPGFAPPKRSRLGAATKPLDVESILDNLEFLPKRTTAENQLCSHCKRLDLREIFEHGIPGSPERGITLGWSDRILHNVRCPFCRLLTSVTSPTGNAKVELWTLTSVDSREDLCSTKKVENDMNSHDSPMPTAICLAVVQTRTYNPEGVESWMRRARLPYRTSRSVSSISLLASLAPPNRRDFSGRIISQNANLPLIKSWIQRCESHPRCKEGSRTPPSSNSLKVLDVRTQQLVDIPAGLRYIALSYVRGSVSMPQYQQGYWGVLPQTLRDAIKVVKDLGFHYIWIDMLIIDNLEHSKKQALIASMDSIYSNAFATIIAMGEDADYGLSGVHPGSRFCIQHRETVKNLELVTTLDSLSFSLKNSCWTTRAWTLQEGLLSQRRIIFGSAQVFFECSQAVWSEATEEPIHQSSDVLAFSGSKGFLRSPFQEDYQLDELYWKLVKEYAKRAMSHESDSLNAFSGILSRLEARFNIRTSWGLPVNRIPSYLLWSHDAEAGDRRIHRRQGFPSWSWVGWSGKVVGPGKHEDPVVTADFLFLEDTLFSHILVCNARSTCFRFQYRDGELSICNDNRLVHIAMDSDQQGERDFDGQICEWLEISQTEGPYHVGHDYWSCECLLVQRTAEFAFRVGIGSISRFMFEANKPEYMVVALL
jgi:hypothetical protein